MAAICGDGGRLFLWTAVDSQVNRRSLQRYGRCAMTNMFYSKGQKLVRYTCCAVVPFVVLICYNQHSTTNVSSLVFCS
jgi:hypothetical protein